MTWAWIDFAILCWVTYRLTRFISVDTLIDEPRDALAGWLLSGDVFFDETNKRWPVSYWKRKMLQWLECPFCQSVWVAAAVLTYWTLLSDYDWSWRWLLDWLAICGASMGWYKFVDPD